MSKKILSIAGVGLLSLGSAFVATPAGASTADCGTAPTGGTMTSSGNVCTLTFDAAGEYTFTPSVLGDLQAIMVGGGGGAEAFGSTGYSGIGGSVVYADLSGEIAGSPLTITVGEGGVSGANPSSGDYSRVDGVDRYTADGGDSGDITHGYCALNGSYSTYMGLGEGSKSASSTVNGEVCGTAGAGITASLGDLDTEERHFGTLFTNYALELGAGGILHDNVALPEPKPGQGASINMNTNTTELVDATDGADGLVSLRWTAGSSLANTGSESSRLSALAGGSILLGAGLMVAGAARRRATR